MVKCLPSLHKAPGFDPQRCKNKQMDLDVVSGQGRKGSVSPGSAVHQSGL